MEEKLDDNRSARIADIPSEEKRQESLRKNSGLARTRRKRRVVKDELARFLDLQERAFNHVVGSSKAVLVVVLVIILLQGFRLAGFNLPKELLYILIVATVSKLAESFYVVLRFLFASGRGKK